MLSVALHVHMPSLTAKRLRTLPKCVRALRSLAVLRRQRSHLQSSPLHCSPHAQIGATTPVFTALIGLLILRKRESTLTYLALVPVVAGTSLASGVRCLHPPFTDSDDSPMRSEHEHAYTETAAIDPRRRPSQCRAERKLRDPESGRGVHTWNG